MLITKKCDDLGHVAPLPPKKLSRSVISSSIWDSSASPGDPSGSLPCLGIRLVSRPYDLSPKLLRGRAYKRGGTLPLLTKAKLVETLMNLHLSTVVGRLLANQML